MSNAARRNGSATAGPSVGAAALWAQRLLANLGRLPRLALAHVKLDRRAPFWLVVRLAAPLEEIPRPHPLAIGEPRSSLLDMLRALRAAAADPRVAGVLLRFAGAPRGLAAAATLHRAVAELRGRKPVWAFGERMGIPEYWVASAAERILLPESGSLELLGLRTERFYLRELLSRLDVRPEVLRVGGYKTAGETLVRDRMSAEQREQSEAYLDDVLARFVEAVAEGRAVAPETVRGALDGGPLMAGSAAEQGWIDACCFPDQVAAELVERVPRSAELRHGELLPRCVEVPSYVALHAADPGWVPLGRGVPQLAYIAASGAVVRGEAPGIASAISARGLGRLLERLRADDRIDAVVLRITSPGGDALASDLLWRSVLRLRERKPVVVSMGEVAASGGYFLAAAASSLVCEAPALTGSIGVLGGKLDLSGLLDRLGLHVDGVERGEFAGMLSPARPFRPEERRALRTHVEALYALFLERVSEGRGLERSVLEPLAQGRVWSGAQARENGLVDLLGGPLEAIAEARRRAGIPDAEPHRLEVLPRVGPLKLLRGRLSPLLRVR